MAHYDGIVESELCGAIERLRVRTCAADGIPDALAEGGVDVIERCRRAIIRLRAIMDKVPKTADGVPMTDGMEIWTTLDLSRDIVSLHVEAMSGLQRPGHHLVGGRWYSSREAAEAAKEKP